MKMVSVIIPVFNATNSIELCMESVRNQTFQDYEVILINDGSTDDSAVKIQNYIDLYNLDNWYLISQKNIGVSRTRNKGILKGKGEYIAFLDSDDIWEERKLEKQVAFMKEHDAFIVSGLFDQIPGPRYWKYQLNDLLFHNYVFTSTVLVKRNALINVGLFDETMKYSEDYNLWLKLVLDYPIYVLNEKLATYDILNQGGGLSSHLWEMEKGELENYKYLKETYCISSIQYSKVYLYSLSKFLLRWIRSNLKRRC